MTLRALTVASERWLDEVVLTTSFVSGGADTNDTFSLPAGLGDVAIMEIELLVVSIATMVATPENLGVGALIQSAASGAIDFAGVSNWRKVSASRVMAWISPDPLCLWRQDELLQLQFPELDTNAAPTETSVVYIKCVRVRPLEGAPRAAIRLVS